MALRTSDVFDWMRRHGKKPALSDVRHHTGSRFAYWRRGVKRLSCGLPPKVFDAMASSFFMTTYGYYISSESAIAALEAALDATNGW